MIRDKRNMAKIALLLVLSIILWHIVTTPRARDTGDVRKECLHSGADTGTDLMSSLRKNAYACDLELVNLENLPTNQLFLTFHSILDQTNVICKRKLRLGKVGDGGWEVCDDPDVRPVPPCIVYSFGIFWDFSFDDEMARLYGCDVYSFDPSMLSENHNRSDKVHFYKVGLSGETGRSKRKWDMFTFEDIRKMLDHMDRKIDIVKMDIEHSEWSALPNMISTGQLTNVKQLLVEYHGKGKMDRPALLLMLKTIQNIDKEGFQKFYIHKNWNCPQTIPGYPSQRTKCYEVHYLHRVHT